ncbi:G1/S-specific cyclin-E isoform X2 [Condylostylus longicornis]|uniref:G1/S-specific cyclin-E isoform X2 n=1 Tax=Condylostylus longicornis TaxID=2530218 RepID=UPI00244DAA4B|nr:G1/S-specific cyclin-E isoform X2 [Condylostylus longicornis]
MEYRSTTKRLSRSTSSGSLKNMKRKNSPNITFNNTKKNSSKSTNFDLAKFFNTSVEKNITHKSNALFCAPATEQDQKIDVSFNATSSSSSGTTDGKSNIKSNELVLDATSITSSETPIHNMNEPYNYISNIKLSSSSSSQLVKNKEHYSKNKLSNSQEIFTKLNSCDKNQRKKRRSSLNEEDFSDAPAPKRMQMMDSLSSFNVFVPVASTSFGGVLRSRTPNSYRNREVCSLSSSVESSSLNSSPSPIAVNEIGEFIEQEMDAASSSSCLSTGVEFDFVPSSDESTLVLESSTSNSRDYEKLQESIGKINEYHATPHKNRALTPSLDMRPCPLPALSWANASDVWNAMCKTDEKAASERTSSMMSNHFGLQPRMRAILLDWLIEVCEVYKLHRETYYLAVDYLDRYLSTQKNIQKTHLQLIGITCLFVAAKVEEIYPPKIGEFAYVTDGACQEEDILQHELLLLSALDWKITPVTIMGWLGIYMQLNITNKSGSAFLKSTCQGSTKDASVLSSKILNKNNCNYLKRCQDKNISCLKENNSFNFNNNTYFNLSKESACKSGNSGSDSAHSSNLGSLFGNDSGISVCSGEIDDSFIYPQFSGYEFSQTAQLIDLCTLDLEIANFPYSIIAATAISHTFGKETAVRVSGYDWDSLVGCFKWMQPFFDIIKDEAQFFFLPEQNEQVQSKQGLGHFCPKIVTDDSHMVQTHTTSITMLEKAFLRREQLSNAYAMHQPEASPAVKNSRHLCPEGLLTPPASSRKPVNNNEGYC